MSELIIEHWQHEPECRALRVFALEQRRRFDGLDPGEVEADWVRPSEGSACLNLLVCRSVDPHVDNWHPEWSALWVLQCGEGHTIHIADRRSRGHCRIRKPSKAVTQSVPLSVGQVVLFNGHRVHWLSAANDGSALVVAGFDSDTRPSRAAIADLINAADRDLARRLRLAA